MEFDDSLYYDQTPRPGVPSEVEQLRTLLYTDDLTRLYNRRFFRHLIAEQKSISDETSASFALLTLDIDHFKQINDDHGHAVGDGVLIQVAEILKQLTETTGWVFRYAGDEFLAILRNSNDEDVKDFCTRVLQSVAHFPLSDSEFPVKGVSMSIGYAFYPIDAASIADLMSISDRALYASKKAGRTCFYSGREILDLDQEQVKQLSTKISTPSFIGRQEEWKQLQQNFWECRHAKGRLVLISGEAGIGKSRILSHFRRRLRAGEHHVFMAECTEETRSHAYAPIREAFRKGFEAQDPTTVNVYRELDELYRRELIGLVPQFDRFEKTPLAPANPEDRYFLLESVLLLLQGLSEQLPTIFILEDIHWADEPTLNLVQYLARNIRNDRILFIGTYREEETVYSHLPAMIQNMSRESLNETIQLGPLNAAETGAMLKDLFPESTISESFQNWIQDETEGNPFYVEELAGLLMEEDHLKRSGKNLEIQEPDKPLLPESIKVLIQRRLYRLEEPQNRLLGYASIIGYEFDLSILTRLVEESEDRVLDLLEHLMKLRLVKESFGQSSERFAFFHNKIRDVLYEDIGTIKRRIFHKRVAEILEKMYGTDSDMHAEDLAYHFECGHLIEKALHYSLQAGKKALQTHDYRKAEMHLARAYQCKDTLKHCPPEQLAEIHSLRGIALEGIGAYEESIFCLEQILELNGSIPSSQWKADALNHLSRIHFKRGEFEESLSCARLTLQQAQNLDYPKGIFTGHHLLAKNYWRICDYKEAMQHLQAAVEIAGKMEEPASIAGMQNDAGMILLEQSHYEEAATNLEAALKGFRAYSDKRGITECLSNLSYLRNIQGNLSDARRFSIQASNVAAEIGDPYPIAACAVARAELEFKLGNSDLGLRLNRNAERTYEDMDYRLGLTYTAQNEARFQMTVGNLPQALQLIQGAKFLAEQKKLKRRMLELLREEAAILFFMGHYERSLSLLELITTICDSIDAQADRADAVVREGFVYFSLYDFEKAKSCWNAVQTLEEQNISGDLLFWHTAASAFIAAIHHQEPDLLEAQDKMRKIAERTEYAHLLICVPLLNSYQFAFLKKPVDGISHAQEAERKAIQFQQHLWLPRIRIMLYELQVKIDPQPSSDQLRQLLDAAGNQGQNEIVHRCYRILLSQQPENEDLQKRWNAHWDSWKTEIPQKYHHRFAPKIV